MAPRRELSTAHQLGVSNGKLFTRAFRLRCPVCGGRKFVRHWFGVAERCPTCALRVERIEGHSLGYVGLNTVVSFTLLFFLILGMTISMVPHINVGLMLRVCLPASLGLPLLFTPWSRTIWTAFDVAVRPLQPGEVDANVVVNQPPEQPATTTRTTRR